MQRLMAETKGVRTRGWNYERPLVFAAVILPMTENVRPPKDIRTCIERRMDLWDQSRSAALVDDTANVGWGGREVPGQGGSAAARDERAVHAYKHTLLSGRTRQAV